MKTALVRPKKWNLLDIFLILLVILALLSAFFTFVQPIHFSGKIIREGVTRFAEVEILLPDDLTWMKESVPVGEEYRNVYGELEWKILGFEPVRFGEKELIKVKAKLLIVEESSGIFRYGKYTLVKGSKIFLINDHYVLEGRVLDFRLLEERILL